MRLMIAPRAFTSQSDGLEIPCNSPTAVKFLPGSPMGFYRLLTSNKYFEFTRIQQKAQSFIMIIHFLTMRYMFCYENNHKVNILVLSFRLFCSFKLAVIF